MGRSLVVGIDFGHHSIKAVAMKPIGELMQLVGYNELTVPEDIFSENHTLDYQKIVKKLKELKKGLPLFSQQVAVSVPDKAVISKVLQIEQDMDGREQEFAVHQAFGQQSPIPLEELSLDFFEVDQKVTTRSTTSTFQVYATRKEVVDSRVAALTKAGLKPLTVDVHANSLLKVWRLASQVHPERRQWMLVDIGLNQTSLCTVAAGRTPFYKEVPFGTQNVAQSQEVSESISLSSDSLTQGFVRELGEKLQRHISLYNSVNPQQNVDGIWISGGGANLVGIADMLSIELSLEVAQLNPFGLVENGTKKSIKQLSDSAAYGVAMGLAISGVEWLKGNHHA
ncbi:type IV pilus assembly protein PilM [Vibrio sp. SCSIO 43132]|uniref:type IV pilus assembly protein PilM n=1 Tax=Vibrio sp. SCSIO 43132 TaxID=2779363 RepID=UPI001CA9D01A|nr:type IV pilus assembly protein PilM [Vibrio sp. SCSIO 43132]UAB70598.1 type IV pilus assembly protein PilM [Vibrio sp. SCSIO 43132]